MKKFKVVWEPEAIIDLAEVVPKVKNKSNKVRLKPEDIRNWCDWYLAEIPHKKGVEFGGRFVTYKRNVAIVYKVVEEEGKVLVQACRYLNNAEFAYIVYGIRPDEE